MAAEDQLMPTQQPNWQPISKLPLVLSVVEPWLKDIEENYASLRQAEDKPHVLDDATVARVTKVYTTQKEDILLYQEQVARWQKLDLTAQQKAQLDVLDEKVSRLAKTIDAILALAEKLSAGTIEKVMAKDDTQLGMEFLLKMMSGKKD
jgi:hypothetical protein